MPFYGKIKICLKPPLLLIFFQENVCGKIPPPGKSMVEIVIVLPTISADVYRGRAFRRFRSKTCQPYLYYQIGHPYNVNL